MATKSGVTHTNGHSKAPKAVRRSIRAEIASYADDIFLTEPEAAEACGVSPNTLKCWRLKREGDGPHKGPPAVKVYDMVRYRAADVRAWLEKMAGAV
jgi:hypothetical protein